MAVNVVLREERFIYVQANNRYRAGCRQHREADQVHKDCVSSINPRSKFVVGCRNCRSVAADGLTDGSSLGVINPSRLQRA